MALNFDFDGARAAGYSNDEILRYLTSPGIQPLPQQTAIPVDQLRNMVAGATARNAARDRVINVNDFRPWQDPSVGPRPAMGPPRGPSLAARPGPYLTQLPPAGEAQFQDWVHRNKIPFDPNPTADYDMRGFFMDKPAMQEREARIAQGGSKHFPDTYKTPFHATFSNESQYATPDAPHWEGDRLIDKSGRVIADETPPTQQINARNFRPWQEPEIPPVLPAAPARYQPDLKSGPLGMVNPEAGIENIIGGAQQMWAPSGTTADDPAFWNQKAEGAARVIRGAGTFGALAAPIGLPAAVAAPIPAVAGLAGGLAAQYGTERLGEAAGVPQGQRELLGSMAGMVGGAMGSQFNPSPEQIAAGKQRVGELWSDEEGSSPAAPRVRNAAGINVRGTMGGAKGTIYNPLPEDIQALATRLRPDNPQSAMRLAEATLKWRNWGKPAAQATYGELVNAPSSATKLQKLQNTPAEVQRRIQQTNDFLAQPTEPWTPVDYGIFDRSLIRDAMGGFPGVQQTSFPRTVAPRADMSFVDEIYNDPVNRDLIKRQITRGLPLGGETFYPSLYPVKAEAVSQNLTSPYFPQTGGDLFDNWIHSVAPGSARNSIYNERAVGNLLRNMKARGIPLTEANVTREMAVFKNATEVGLPLMPVHSEGAAKVLEQGISPIDVLNQNATESYKIPTYAANQTGNFARSWTGDVHEAAGETLGSRFHPYFTEQGGFGKNEYGPAERNFLSIADEMSLPGGSAQAGRWFGGGEMTGLLSPRGDSLDLLERQAAYTLHQMGRRTDPVSVRNYLLKLQQEGGRMLPWQSAEQMPDYREFARGRGRR